jgi:hypothetical protein
VGGISRQLVAVLAIMMAASGCTRADPGPTGYVSQRTALANVIDHTSDEEWAVDTTQPAVLEHGTYEGDVVGVTLTLCLKTKLPHSNWASYAQATATVTDPSGTTVNCADKPGKKRSGQIFEPDHVIEIDCDGFTTEVSSTVTVSSG